MYTLDREKRHDIAEYFGPVEIKRISGKGRGLVVKEKINMGQLIMCSKAFEIAFDQDTIHFRGQNEIPDTTEWDNSNTCEGRVFEKLKMDASLRPQIQKLYSGDDTDSQSKPWKTDDDLTKGLHSVMKFNSFRCEENLSASTAGGKNLCALWILPSYFNHSCIDSNAYYQLFGDMMFVRAVKKIREGEEVTITYWPVNHPARREVIAARNFMCECRLCQLERKDEEEGSPVPAKISNLLKLIRQNFNSGNPNLDISLECVRKIAALRPELQRDLNVALLSPEVDALLKLTRICEKSIFILEAMHSVCANNALVFSSPFQSQNLARCYTGEKDAANVRKWWRVFKRDVLAAHGDFTQGVKINELGLHADEIEFYEKLEADPNAKLASIS
ncbi:uncharacterized protein LOC118437735 [Folsomia candida]|nr:uncharacterized protein LOC118437735 [Folsomia candida]